MGKMHDAVRTLLALLAEFAYAICNYVTILKDPTSDRVLDKDRNPVRMKSLSHQTRNPPH